MKRLSAAAATIALAATLVLGGMPVSAGGTATVTIAGPTTPAVAGQPWALDVEVLQHGVTPIDWEQLSLVGRNGESGEVAAANGHPNGEVGTYLLEVTFPSVGEWTFEFGLRDLVVMNPTPTPVSVVASADGVVTDPGTVSTGAADCT
jgi:hypothetical protein